MSMQVDDFFALMNGSVSDGSVLVLKKLAT